MWGNDMSYKNQNIIPLFKVRMSRDVEKAVIDVLYSGIVGQGPKVEEFEAKLKKHFGNLLTMTLNSATSGLHLALHMIKSPYLTYTGSHSPPMPTWEGLRDDDEVLATPLTCTATNWPVLANGLKLKWVDVDPKTCNMDLDDLERKITSTTKAIVVVHWGGNPVDLSRLAEIQKRANAVHGFKPVIIEDCAHAMGTKYNDAYLGNHGNICVYSFQAIKHFTTVDGGCIILPHADMYRRAKLLRWYGIDRDTNAKDFRCEDDIPEWGFKFHMNDLNASIGIANMSLIDDTVSAHQMNSLRYKKEIDNPHVRQLAFSRDSAQWIHTLRVDDQPDFMSYMKNSGIMVSRVHERNDKHSCVKDYAALLPGLDKISKEMICIPNGWWLTESEVDHIINSINKWKM